MSKSKSGHILYLFTNFPFFIFWKIGITGGTASGRARGLDRSVPGKPIRVFAIILPGAYHVEQWMHRKFAHSNVVWYKGDGRTEWFMFWIAPFAFLIMLAIAIFEGGVLCWIAGQIFGFDGLGWYICFLQVLWEWAGAGWDFISRTFDKLY